MATLRKTKEAKSEYTITVEASFDTVTFAESYKELYPEKDMVTQLLVYAHKHDWNIRQDTAYFELMQQLENHLTEDELLEISDTKRVEANVSEIAEQLASVAHSGIEYITITKFGEEYELDVTEKDIRKIFLEMIV